MKKSLLQLAKSSPHKRGPYRLRQMLDLDELIEVSLAWVRGELSTSSVAFSLGKVKTGSIYSQMAIGLKNAYQQGKLTIKP